jgi:hypothetical protein
VKETLNENFILDAMGIVLVGAVGLYGTAYAAAYAYDRVVTGADKLASVMTKVNNKLEMNKLAKTIEPIVERFKTDTQLQDMYKALPKYAVDRTGVNTDATRKQNNERNKQLAKIATYIKSKLQPDELKYFNDISKSLRSSTVTESKINSAKLKQIIREEVRKVLTEAAKEKSLDSMYTSILDWIYHEKEYNNPKPLKDWEQLVKQSGIEDLLSALSRNPRKPKITPEEKFKLHQVLSKFYATTWGRDPNKVVDPLDAAFGKIYDGGDAKLDKFDVYLEKLGLFTIHEKWLEDNDSLTPAERKQLTTATVAFVNGKR